MKIPRIETLILIFCFLAVLMWAVSKCNSRRAKLVPPATTEIEARPIKRDTVFIRDQSIAAPSTAVPTAPASKEPYKLPANPGELAQQSQVAAAMPAVAAAPRPAAQPAPQVIVKNQTMLYVTIDGLKLRKEPGLKTAEVAKLDLHEQVIFLNEKSDYTQELNLGKEMATDYWYKVKTKSGKVGWVFGAGLHFAKQRRKGVLD